MSGLKRTVEPAAEPITLTEAKAHARITSSADDALVTSLIVAARMAVEQELARALITQTWQLTLDTFPDAIRLDYGPVASVTSVVYKDVANAPQTLSTASYSVDLASDIGWIVPAHTYAWPAVWPDINSVVVTYVTGYGNAAAVPQAIKQWLLLMVAHYYVNREASYDTRGTMAPLPFIDGLLDPFRVVRV